MADNRNKTIKLMPPAEAVPAEVVRTEVVRWVERVRSELSALYVSASELRDEVRDNPAGLVGRAFGDCGGLHAVVCALEHADQEASALTLPLPGPLPDPMRVAGRVSTPGGR